MGKLRVLILDFDGVVIEYNSVKGEAFRWLFGQFPEHLDAMLRFHEEHVSASRFVKFDHLLKLLGREKDTVLRENLANQFSERVFEEITKVPMVYGSEELLRELRPHMPIYLASVTPEPELLEILNRRRLSQWFTGVYGCPPWTKPDAIRAILAREAAPCDAALLVGDSAGDQLAAQEAGIRFVARDSGLPFAAPTPPRFPDLHSVLKYLHESFS